MAIAIFNALSKVDFCAIVQNKKARAANSGWHKTRRYISDILIIQSLAVLDFAHNQKSTRMLNE